MTRRIQDRSQQMYETLRRRGFSARDAENLSNYRPAHSVDAWGMPNVPMDQWTREELLRAAFRAGVAECHLLSDDELAAQIAAARSDFSA